MNTDISSRPSGADEVSTRTLPPPGLRRLVLADIESFVHGTLFSAARAWPVVAVTTSGSSGQTRVDVTQLETRLAGRAELVLIETGDATRALSAAMPPMLAVYGGALRVWWPGLTPDSDPYAHRLFLIKTEDEAEDAVRQLLAMLDAGAAAPGGPAPRAAASAEAWRAIGEEFRVGDFIRGRVTDVKDFGVFVELLPGARGLIHISELDWDFVRDPATLVQPNEVVDAKILSLDVEGGRCELSLKRGWEGEARAATGFVGEGEPQGLPATKPRAESRGGRVVTPAVGDDEESAGAAEPAALRAERTRLQQRVRELEKELRAERDRFEHLRRRTAHETDPGSSPEAFLLGVRLAYARLYGEGERRQYPLAPMRVGPEFLRRVAELQGVPLEKVIEVCAHVASGRAHEIRAREVHQLRAGEGGAPIVVRKRDGAKAWRCSLQDGTPSARRLHWWAIPEADGAVEFASVAVHDDYSMPE